MTGRRENNRQKVQKRYMDALKRLQEGKPLIVAPPYSINSFTVEKEAGYSRSALRNYPEIVEKIEVAKQIQRQGLTQDNQGREIIDDTKRLRADKKKQIELKKEYRSKYEHAEAALQKAHRVQAELVMALHNMLTREQRQKLYGTKVVELFHSNDEK